jgi:hypothetical protein
LFICSLCLYEWFLFVHNLNIINKNWLWFSYLFRGPIYSPTVRYRSDTCFISLKVNSITCVICGQKPNRLLTKERSRTSETRYHRRTNNWQGHTRTQKNTYMNNADSIKTWIQSWWTGSVSIRDVYIVLGKKHTPPFKLNGRSLTDVVE